LDILLEEKEEEGKLDKSSGLVEESFTSNKYNLIGFREPFYYCKEHFDVKNINREAIEHHILYSTIHKSP
jgi:hypothetical protein